LRSTQHSGFLSSKKTVIYDIIQSTVGYKTDGKPIRKYKYGKSRQEVAKRVAALTDEVFANGYVTESASIERNFEVLCREWFDLFVASTTTSRTEEARRMTLKNHIFPAFGKFDVQDIDLNRLQRFFNEKTKNYAPDTVHKMKNLLNNFFNYAVKQHYLKTNPMTDVTIRRVKVGNSNGKKSQALKPEIRTALLGLVNENPVLKPIIITSLRTRRFPLKRQL